MCMYKSMYVIVNYMYHKQIHIETNFRKLCTAFVETDFRTNEIPAE